LSLSEITAGAYTDVGVAVIPSPSLTRLNSPSSHTLANASTLPVFTAPTSLLIS